MTEEKAASGGRGRGHAGGGTQAQDPHFDELGAREVRIATLSALAFVVGVIAAFGAVIFRMLISVVHNFFFEGRFGLWYDANVYEPPSPWGAFIILAPAIGGLAVVWLVKNFAPEAKGHGVPEVMYAIYHRSGIIRGVVAVVKSLASAISIGSGASVGREGPIIQIGSAFGSSFAQFIRLVRWQRITLLASGAGAGIAATFNTPLGGVLFAVELLLPEVSGRTFLPVVVATATATYIGRVFLGMDPAFFVPGAMFQARDVVSPEHLAAYVILGVLAGVVAWIFVRTLAFMEDFFPQTFKNDYVANIVGMLLVGLLGWGFYNWTGHYEVMSVGYATIQNILYGNITTIAVLAALVVGKLLATTISLGAGASGGVFSPSLFIGASLGGLVAAIGAWLLPDAGFSVKEFAVVGMGALVGAATSAGMTAVVMIFEMTRDYNVIVPLVLAVAISLGVRRWLIEDDIYTIKLRHRGKRIPLHRNTNMYLIMPASELMTKKFGVIQAYAPVSEAAKMLAAHDYSHLVVADGKRIVGYVQADKAVCNLVKDSERLVKEFLRTDFVVTREDVPMNDVITRMNRHRVHTALVVRRRDGVPRIDDVVGIISEAELAEAVIENHYS